MRLFPHTPASGCNSTKIGTMYYDSAPNENQIKVCTKDGWKNIGGGLSSTTFTNPTKTLNGTAYPLCMTGADAFSASVQMTTINQFCSENGYEFGELFDLQAEAANYAYYYNSKWKNDTCGAYAISVKCFK